MQLYSMSVAATITDFLLFIQCERKMGIFSGLQNKLQKTKLQIEIEAGNVTAVKKFLNTTPSLVTATYQNKYTALHLEAHEGEKAIVKVLFLTVQIFMPEQKLGYPIPPGHRKKEESSPDSKNFRRKKQLLRREIGRRQIMNHVL